jgi:hypothetical protein
MNTAFALDYIPRRMNELGYGNGYITRYRHFQMDASSVLNIDAENEHYFLIEPSDNLLVKSKAGTYNINDESINEMQYEHRGKIKISNLSKNKQFVIFIQVIPFHQSPIKI